MVTRGLEGVAVGVTTDFDSLRPDGSDVHRVADGGGVACSLRPGHHKTVDRAPRPAYNEC